MLIIIVLFYIIVKRELGAIWGRGFPAFSVYMNKKIGKVNFFTFPIFYSRSPKSRKTPSLNGSHCCFSLIFRIASLIASSSSSFAIFLAIWIVPTKLLIRISASGINMIGMNISGFATRREIFPTITEEATTFPIKYSLSTLYASVTLLLSPLVTNTRPCSYSRISTTRCVFTAPSSTGSCE
mgnify:CR=1 FL=1